MEIVDNDNSINLNLKVETNLLKNRLNLFSSKLENNLHRKDHFMRKQIHAYSNNSGIYVKELSNSNYIQYSHIYFLRLTELKNCLKTLAKEKWRNCKICENILDIKGKVKFKIYLFLTANRKSKL